MIDEFKGENDFLSNFFKRVVIVDFLPAFPGLAIDCLTNEHAFQACKTEDQDASKLIVAAADASTAKKLGNQCKLIDDWDDKRIEFMRQVCDAKFQQHFDLKLKLLATGEQDLVEGNTWKDDFWGVVKRTGQGENNLGKILMEIRADIRKEEGNILQILKGFLDEKGIGFIGEDIETLHAAAIHAVQSYQSDDKDQLLIRMKRLEEMAKLII